MLIGSEDGGMTHREERTRTDGGQPNRTDGTQTGSVAGDEPRDAGDLALENVFEQLDTLEQTVDAPKERREVRETRSMLHTLSADRSRLFDGRIRRYTTRDVAESFVGGILLSLPLLVEDGVFDIADHFAAALVAGIPVFFVANVVFIVLLTAGLLYWTDIRTVENHKPIFGIIPQRLAGVLVISFIVAAGLMTLWGRVEGWQEPDIALYRISVIWAAAAFGAALGDILSGPSGGTEVRELFDRS